MSAFVIAMIVGLGGLALMAFPGGGRHRGRSGHHGHGRLHGHHGLRAAKGPKHAGGVRTSDAWRALKLLPDPRTIFSLLALFGAVGNVFDRTLHLSFTWACVAAAAVAVGLEATLVAPLFRFVLRFQGKPSSPLTELVAETGQAVTSFRNGKGIVQVVRDGRSVQFAARLKPEQLDYPVRVGDTVRIDDVDLDQEKVTVSVI